MNDQDNQIAPEANNPLDEVSTFHNQQLAAEASKSITGLHQELVTNIPISILPESVFKDYFLDYFLDPIRYAKTPLLGRWLEMAGGPFNPVDIIDETGLILYRVPSAYISCSVDYTNLKKYNFSNIAATYIMKRQITEAVASNYITTTLSSIDINIRTNVQEYVMAWATVFNRYSKTSTAPGTTPKESKDTNIDIGILDI